MIHLKLACLRELDPAEGRRFLGFDDAPAAHRQRLWARLRTQVPDWAAATFDAAPRAIAEGLLNAGKFERYLALFRRLILPLTQRPRVVAELASLADPAAQTRLYEEHWDSRRWRALFRIFFGRRVMKRIGRERAFFTHVTAEAIGDVFRARARKALCDLPVATNPYLLWILTGRSLPPAWLDERYVGVIRSRMDRLRLVEADLATALRETPPGTFAGFNLSDCFEYCSPEETTAAQRLIARAATPGARMVYWNLLVPRDASALPDLFTPETDLATELFREDRAFFYGRLVIERVR